jgi:cytochrome P450
MYICIFAAVLFVVFQASQSVYRKLRRSRLERVHACGSPPQTSSTLLGLPQIVRLVQALKENQFLLYVQGLFSRHGTTFEYNTLGNQSIWTTDPENIQACLVSQAQDFEVGATRHKALIPFLGYSVLTTEGQSWQHHRSMMRRNFAKTQMENLGVFERHFSIFLDCVPQDGSTFEIRNLLQKLTMDISSDFLLGWSTNSLSLYASNVKDEFSEAWDIATAWLPLRCHLGALMDWFPHPSFFNACHTIQNYADRLVSLALAAKHGDKVASDDNRYIFLHQLAKEVTDRVQLRDHAISILTAGRDTTAETLSSIINALVRHGDALTRLRHEINELRGEKPTSEAIKNMPYLRNVILES